MSGTSLDGVDLCYVKFNTENAEHWSYEILQAETISYTQNWELKLKQAIQLSTEDLLSLNSEYGFFLAELVQTFIRKNNIKELDIIASHGHTVFHQPHRLFTLQIGDGRAIQQLNKIPVAYDFRSQDVLLGGNGAPLVPIGDEMLFSSYDACVNLGGFSNISFKNNQKRIAFDICPVNIVLNSLALQLGAPYDDKGNWAKKGNINSEVLYQLNDLEFYKKNPPKSLGVEWVIAEIQPLLQSLEVHDALATFTEHIVQQISQVIQKHQLTKVLFSGGGAYNDFLMSKIAEKSQIEIELPSSDVIQYKEALIFALMGVLRLLNKNNVLSSATGSRYDHCSGLLV